MFISSFALSQNIDRLINYYIWNIIWFGCVTPAPPSTIFHSSCSMPCLICIDNIEFIHWHHDQWANFLFFIFIFFSTGFLMAIISLHSHFPIASSIGHGAQAQYTIYILSFNNNNNMYNNNCNVQKSLTRLTRFFQHRHQLIFDFIHAKPNRTSHRAIDTTVLWILCMLCIVAWIKYLLTWMFNWINYALRLFRFYFHRKLCLNLLFLVLYLRSHMQHRFEFKLENKLVSINQIRI